MMSNKLPKTIATFLALVACTLLLHAGGGWPQKKGEGYFKLYEWWVVADQHYTDRGLLDPNVTTGLYNTSIYAEYGMTNRLTLVGHIPFFSRATVNNVVSSTSGETLVRGDAINSVGDASFALKYGLTPGRRISVAPSLTLGLPIGISSGGRDNNLQTGDGEFNQLIQVDAGMGFLNSSKVPMYANIYVGFNNRTQGYSDEIRLGGEVGAMFMERRLTAVLRSDVVQSLYNGIASGRVTSTSTFANNTEYVSVGLEINYRLKGRWGVSAGMAGAVAGKVILAAPSYQAGLFFVLD